MVHRRLNKSFQLQCFWLFRAKGVQQCRMSSKQEDVLNYIAGMKPGEHFSVRGLAKTLNVSEGTAYKSLKQAEAQSLVSTKPKTGTVRINARPPESSESITLAEAARNLGVACICGAEKAAVTKIVSTVVADGSKAQLSEAIEKAVGSTLCLIGDRPELQLEAIGLGAEILLTGGARAGTDVIAAAEKAGCCIFASRQDGFTILSLLQYKLGLKLPHGEISSVRDWMHEPPYLYHDDMVADWHRLYHDMFSEYTACAVVDDDLKICGTINAMTAMRAIPSQRMSNLITAPDDCCVVDESSSMSDLAGRMLSEKRILAFVTANGGMTGFISASDVLRYYQYEEMSGGENEHSDDFHLELISEQSDTSRHVYMAYLQNTDEWGAMSRNQAVNLVFAAANLHARELFSVPFEFESGTFYAPKYFGGRKEFMISSEVMKKSSTGCALELEMYDDSFSYIKCTLILSVADEHEAEE